MPVKRRLDDLGRVVLPVEWRRELGLKAGDEVQMDIAGGQVIVTRKPVECIFCFSDVNLRAIKGRAVCGACVESLGRS